MTKYIVVKKIVVLPVGMDVFIRLQRLLKANNLLNRNDKARIQPCIREVRQLIKEKPYVSFQVVGPKGYKKSFDDRKSALRHKNHLIRNNRLELKQLNVIIKYFKHSRYELVGGVFLKKSSILHLLKLKKIREIKQDKGTSTAENHVGIEIEAISNHSLDAICEKIAETNFSKYVAVGGDGSIRVREEDSEEGFKYPLEIKICAPSAEIKSVISNLLETLKGNLVVNASCGMHVHLDMRNRDVEKSFNNLAAAQSLLYAMNPKSRASGTWCKRIRNRDFKNHNPSSRYRGINTLALNKHRTIEVRIHSATVDAGKITNWVTLLERIVDLDEKLLRLPIKSFNKKLKLSDDLSAYIKHRIAKFSSESNERECA